MTHIPIRQCAACREKSEKNKLWRFYGSLQRGKGVGRGVYLCKNAACVKKARKSNAIGRALSVSVPDEFYDNLLREVEA